MEGPPKDSPACEEDLDDELLLEMGDDDNDDYGDSDCKSKARHAITGRGVTLSMLMSDGLIEPGEDCLSIEYLGRKFRADLLVSGKIHSIEDGLIFSSPSAWAIHCKKLVNPEKKSGCGWASVRYKGKKLDVYKSTWVRKQTSAGSLDSASNLSLMDSLSETPEREITTEGSRPPVIVPHEPSPTVTMPIQEAPLNLSMSSKTPASTVPPSGRPSVKHSTLGNKCSDHDPTTLVECSSFQNPGRIQPFNVTITSNALLLLDFHCHLTTSEVIGYLAGKWDPASQHLIVQQAFPCRCRLGDRDRSPLIEDEIRQNMFHRGLSLVGWYHSHPNCQPDPSLRDIESQMEYQLKLKGASNIYLPCVALINSPYMKGQTSQESSLRVYWVMPPPEQKPLLYGTPMSMQYSVYQDMFLTQDILNDMKSVTEFYKGAPDLINMYDNWNKSTTYLEKLKGSLTSKFPKDQTDGRFVEYIHSILTPS